MKNKFQLIVLLILGVALAGGVYLSQRSQETRRGAAGGEKVVLFMPDERSLKVGEVLETTIVVGTEPGYGLSAATLNIKYNPQVVDFQTADALSYFGIFNETGVSGDKNFDLVYKPGGATFGPVSLVKLRFLAKVAGAVDLNVGGNIDLLEAENNTLSAAGGRHKIVFLTSEMVAKPDYVVMGETISVTSGLTLNLSLASDEPVVEGKPFEVWINYDTGDPTEKVSSLKMSLRAEGMLEIGEVSTKGTAFSRVDSGNAKDLNLVVMQPSSVLLSKGRVAKLTLTALVTNPMNIYHQTGLPPSLHVGVEEVVGIDGEGKPLSFPISDDIRDHGVWLGIQPIRQTLTSTPDMCRFCPEGERILGDANCDSAISMLDFEVWRSAKYDGTPVSVRAMANLDCSSDGVMMADFEVWRKAMFDK